MTLLKDLWLREMEPALDSSKELALLIHRRRSRLDLITLRYYDKLTKEGLAPFKTAEAIETIQDLQAGALGLNDNDLEAISGLKNLTVLSLRANPVKDLHFLKPLKQLQSLDLDYTKIDSAGMKVISELPNLNVLALNHAQVPDEAWRYLHGLHPTVVFMKECPISKNTLKQLNEKFPHRIIQTDQK